MPRTKSPRPVRGRPVSASLADRRREEILAAATHFFARHGFHCANLQDLADELVVGKGTIYRYFPSKEKLFLATADRVMTLMRAEIDTAISEASDGLDVIVLAVLAYLRFFDSHPEFVEIIVQERSVLGSRRKPTYFAHRDMNAGQWIRRYERLMKDGRIRRMSIDAIRDVISSAVYGTMFTNYFAGRDKSLEKQAEEMVDVIFMGILTDTERCHTRWKPQRRRGNGGNS